MITFTAARHVEIFSFLMNRSPDIPHTIQACISSKIRRRALRFGIHNNAGLRATTLKLWTETAGGKTEVYLANRSLGGMLKASLHESGQWHIAYSQQAFEKRVKGAIPKFKDRYIENWPRPAEFASGMTLAFRIRTPWSAVTTPIVDSNIKRVIWLPNAPELRATEIDILITKPTIPVTGWPGEQSLSTLLIGSIPLENGETVWAVHRVIDMPDLSSLGKGTGWFCKGRSEKDLESEGLRDLVHDTAPDGSRIMHDCAIQRRKPKKQIQPTQ